MNLIQWDGTMRPGSRRPRRGAERESTLSSSLRGWHASRPQSWVSVPPLGDRHCLPQKNRGMFAWRFTTGKCAKKWLIEGQFFFKFKRETIFADAVIVLWGSALLSDISKGMKKSISSKEITGWNFYADNWFLILCSLTWMESHFPHTSWGCWKQLFVFPLEIRLRRTTLSSPSSWLKSPTV